MDHKNYTRPRLFEELVEALLGQLEVLTGSKVVLPIPVEEIATTVLRYRVLTDDLGYLKETIRGVTLPQERKILVDSSCNYLRRRFVLAHEIGHILLRHSSYHSDSSSTYTQNIFSTQWDKEVVNYLSKSRETQANKFAGALLIPRHFLIPRLVQFPIVDAEVIRPLVEEFEVSFPAMIYRLLELAEENLLYFLTDQNLPEWVSVDVSSLEEAEECLRKKGITQVIRRPPLRESSRKLTRNTNAVKLAPVLYASSEENLIDLVTYLDNKNQDGVGIILGGTSCMNIENKHVLETIKGRGKKSVIICDHEHHATYLRHFSSIVDHVIVYKAGAGDEGFRLPTQIWKSVLAQAQFDEWAYHRLWERAEDREDFEPRAVEIIPREQEEPVQLSLWPIKPLNMKNDARLFIKSTKREGKKAVLVTGCFDLLHIGHVTFLQNAKKQDEVLVVGVESDRRVWRYKGKVINNVRHRCEMLEALSCVDFVFVISDSSRWKGIEFYEHLCRSLRPNYRATTEDDPYSEQKRAQIEVVNGDLRIVSDYVHGHSTTNDFAKMLLSRPKELQVWKLKESSDKWKTAKGPLGYSKWVPHSNGKEEVQVTPESLKQLDLFN